MLMVVLGLFIVCRGPWHLSDLVIDAVLTDDDQQYIADMLDDVRQLATILVFFNSWTTPVIFAMFNVRIRNLLLDVLRCRRSSEQLSSSTVAATGTAIAGCFGVHCKVSSSPATHPESTPQQRMPAVDLPVSVIELRHHV